MRVRQSTPDPDVTAATIDAGPQEPQTTVIFRVWEGGCDLLTVFTPNPRQGQRPNDQSKAVRLA